MALLVQKFGGTSVGCVERIQAVARRIQRSREAGNAVVAVVSAMGQTTDELTGLANAISPDPPRREMDMLLASGEQVSIALLSMALQACGVAAVSMTGHQVGIVTESAHGRARILEIRTDRLRSRLEAGQVVVVAGFQGMSVGMEGTPEITTLGRGGSDTSAVALAVALGADLCEIYTDVEGVFTTDPRRVPEARLMEMVSCDEMLELASLGAAVLHPRAVEIARNHGLPLAVRSSWSEHPGTLLTSRCARRGVAEGGMELGKPVDGAELLPDQGLVALSHIPDQPGVAADLFNALGREGINVDLIVQSVHEGDSNDIAFSLDACDLDAAAAVARRVFGAARGFSCRAQADLAKLSISGAGIMGRPAVAAGLFGALGHGGISVRLIATSEVKLSCLVDGSRGDEALAIARRLFGLSRYQQCRNAGSGPDDLPAVSGVALDLGHAQLSVLGVPGQPGSAARICRILADTGISVDMIVQSERCRPTPQGEGRDITFTLARRDVERARLCLTEGLEDWRGCQLLLGEPIARVSAVGAGMARTPGCAAHMFEAIAAGQVNIEMIATSEIRTSCVVAANRGVQALRLVHAAFGLAGEGAEKSEQSKALL